MALPHWPSWAPILCMSFPVLIADLIPLNAVVAKEIAVNGSIKSVPFHLIVAPSRSIVIFIR